MLRRPDDTLVLSASDIAAHLACAHLEQQRMAIALACSSGEDVPRGLDFLFSPNRLNVAVSRAQCLAVLVHNPRLLDAAGPTVEHMALVDGACRFVELATENPWIPSFAPS